VQEETRQDKGSVNQTSDQPEDIQAHATLVPESVPHFKSFEHVTDQKLRRALDYEQYLQWAKGRFPDFGHRLDIEIAWCKSEQGRSKESDRDLILACFDSWDDLLCEEIADDLGFTYQTTYKILKGMLEVGLLKAHERPGVRGNKPMLVYSRTSNAGE
jgi:hypothetical protein